MSVEERMPRIRVGNSKAYYAPKTIVNSFAAVASSNQESELEKDFWVAYVTKINITTNRAKCDWYALDENEVYRLHVGDNGVVEDLIMSQVLHTGFTLTNHNRLRTADLKKIHNNLERYREGDIA